MRRSSESDLCDRCVQEGYTREDVPGSRYKPQKIKKRCPSCGEEFGTHRNGRDIEIGVKIDILGDDVLLCVHCISGSRSGADWGYWLPTQEDSPPLAEGFNELFKAARVLLEEDAPESQVIPTLALANHLCHGVPRLVTQKEWLVGLWGDGRAWNEEVDRFVRRYSGLRPVRAAQGVLILERQPVSIGIDYSLTQGSPVAVTVSVYPHQTTLAEPEAVASLYSERLSDEGISCNEQHRGNLTFFFRNDRLELDISPGTAVEYRDGLHAGWWTGKASFPHPRLVQRLYRALREEFAGDLETRERGDEPKAKNLVPACVAFLLREYGIPPRKEINRLLDKHMLCKTAELLDGNTSRTNQLWENVNNTSLVRGPLMDAAQTLFYEGYE